MFACFKKKGFMLLCIQLACGIALASAKPDTTVTETLEGIDPGPDSEWSISHRSAFDRSTPGKEIEKRANFVANDTWLEKSRVVTFVDSQGRDTLKINLALNIEQNAWDTTSIRRTNYVSVSLVETWKEYDWVGTKKVRETRDIYTFDANDSIATIEHYVKNENGGYVQEGKTEYDRSVNGKIALLSYIFEDQTMKLQFKTVLVFDSEGRLVSDSAMINTNLDDPEDSAYLLSSATTYTYNSDDYLAQTIQITEFAGQTGMSFRTTYHYASSSIRKGAAPHFAQAMENAAYADVYTVSGKWIARVDRIPGAGLASALPGLSAGSYIAKYAAPGGQTFCRPISISRTR